MIAIVELRHGLTTVVTHDIFDTNRVNEHTGTLIKTFPFGSEITDENGWRILGYELKLHYGKST